MPLNFHLLENLRADGENYIARCPACAEKGRDRTGNHLCIFPDGAFHCVARSDEPGHNQKIYQLAGNRRGARRRVVQWLPEAAKAKPTHAPRMPDLHRLTTKGFLKLCEIRGWPSSITPALETLWERRLIFYADVYDGGETWQSWLITDSARRGAQARRLDGKEWAGIGAKAKSIPGSNASWPIGAADIGDCPIVLLCEGQPDFVAALPVAFLAGAPIHKIAPVCMAGAGNRIDEDALVYFKEKRVRIFSHPDEAGQLGAARWAAQLWKLASKVDGFTFEGIARANGTPVKDLADYLAFLNEQPGSNARIMRDLI